VSDKYTVQDGDSIASIAKDHGYLWKTIWDHPDNADLKKLRKDPNVLLAGDVVTLPDPVNKEEQRPTGKRHTFVRKGEPTKLRVKLTRFGKARAGVEYKLIVDGTEIKGRTDGSGWVDQFIPGNARQARLVVGKEEHVLKIGHLDPLDSVSGVQARLRNLGYDCGGEDGEVGELTARALRAFQQATGLPPTGKIDPQTCDKLKETHG
jgi:N-acetylmuramoyl-L-alanine amidase